MGEFYDPGGSQPRRGRRPPGHIHSSSMPTNVSSGMALLAPREVLRGGSTTTLIVYWEEWIANRGSWCGVGRPACPIMENATWISPVGDKGTQRWPARHVILGWTVFGRGVHRLTCEVGLWAVYGHSILDDGDRGRRRASRPLQQCSTALATPGATSSPCAWTVSRRSQRWQLYGPAEPDAALFMGSSRPHRSTFYNPKILNI